jgi:hypothetical protein
MVDDDFAGMQAVYRLMGYEVRLSNVRLVTASAAHILSERIDPSRLPRDFSYEVVMFRRHELHFISHLLGKTMIMGLMRSIVQCG